MKKRYFFAGIASGMAIILLLGIVLIGFNGAKNYITSIGTMENVATTENTKEEKATGATGTVGDSNRYNEEYKDFDEKVNDVLGTLEDNYLEGVDADALYEEAIRGLVDSVGDPYTSCFTKSEYASFIEKMEGSYEGIGVVVSYGETQDVIVVVAPFKNSPGELAGMKPSDRIIAVDKVDVIGMSLDKVVERIKGKDGTEVVLTVLRESGEEMIEIDIPIIRAVIEIPTIEHELLEDNIGYIQMSGFDIITEDQFKAALKDLEKQDQDGLIIDLRNNPGGYLHIVYAIVDELIKKGNMVVYTEDRDGKREELITKNNHSFDKPLVILINGNSASASEILAGAIKDHEKGVLVGETSFGKGLVQRTFELDDDSAIKITISKYYTPDGHYIHGVGIEPDVVVEYDAESETDNQLDEAIKVITEMIDKQ
jgi:carboxyl-terminal processing protease